MKHKDKVKETLDQIGTKMSDIAREHLEQEGYYDPAIVVLYEDGRQEFLYPRYQNEKERQEAFEKVNRYLVDTEAVGIVLLMETWFFPKDSTAREEALLMLKQGWGISEYETWTFGRGPDEEVQWKDHHGPGVKHTTMMITAFKEVQ